MGPMERTAISKEAVRNLVFQFLWHHPLGCLWSCDAYEPSRGLPYPPLYPELFQKPVSNAPKSLPKTNISLYWYAKPFNFVLDMYPFSVWCLLSVANQNAFELEVVYTLVHYCSLSMESWPPFDSS